MTSIVVNNRATGWGETRAAERAARRTKRRIALVTGAIALPLGTGIIAGLLYDPTSHLPAQHQWLVHLAVVAVLALVGTIAWRNWHDADEMQRRHAIECWAVIGLANFILNPASTVIAERWNMPGLDGHSWSISLLLGLSYYAVRRVRS